MRIALFQPDIAGDVGTILRLGACLAVPVDIIEPCGFPLGDRQLRRAAMDYGAAVDARRHADWETFCADHAARGGRLVLLSSKADQPLYRFDFAPDDTLLFGSEGAGVPDPVRDACAAVITIPMAPGFRSLNVAVTAGIALGEAVRQTRFDTIGKTGD